VESSLLLSELLSAERVRVPLESHSKADLLRELVHLALPDGSAETIGGVIAAVEAREREVSTAMGAGLAVPHGRTDRVPEVRVAAGLVSGVGDYEAPDGIPVRVVFLVLTPSSASGLHVKLLAQIARVMHAPDARAALFAARTPEEFLGVIHQADEQKRVPVS
jgi:mannitol/fructose-specific phosphotransferase system IIA component (Ntr-type)